MLTINQVQDLNDSINDYDFPSVAYDFEKKAPLIMESMDEVEKYIQTLLISDDNQSIKNGLANVLYWGYSTSGYRDYRVTEFTKNVTLNQLDNAKLLFSKSKNKPSMIELKKLGMPQFSGISFLSKIRMFLNPEHSATLDLQIMKMKFANNGDKSVLNQFSHNTGQILPNSTNSKAYESWCSKLQLISEQYFESKYRVADVERGFFKIIRDNKPDYATEILVNS